MLCPAPKFHQNPTAGDVQDSTKKAMSNPPAVRFSIATCWTGQTHRWNGDKWCHFPVKIGEMSEASSLVDVLWSDPFI